MNAYEYIINKQIEWANNKGLKLIGSQGDRGRQDYTSCIKDNLFQPLNEETRRNLEDGDGHELSGTKEEPAKIQALHSSSALGINIFDYWYGKPDLSTITASCGLSDARHDLPGELRFEQKYSIEDHFPIPPNIDVVIKPNRPGRHLSLIHI